MKGTNFKIGAFASILLVCCFMLTTVGLRAQNSAPGDRVQKTLPITGGSVTTTDHQTRDFVIPAGVYSIDIECWGAGAAGSYIPLSYSRHDPYSGVGGGGGAYAKKTGVAVTPNQTISITIGRGGIGDGSSHSNGGDTYVTVGGTVVCKAAGAPSVPNNKMTGGSLGGQIANCIGDVKYSGGNGGSGLKGEYPGSGGGGGAAGRSGNGGNGGDGVYGYRWGVISRDVNNGGTGGNAGSGYPFAPSNTGKGADGLHSVVDGVSGNAGNNYGGGGSGPSSSLYTGGDGGNGGDGVIVISYTECAVNAGTIQRVSTCDGSLLQNVTSATDIPGSYFWQYRANASAEWATIASSGSENHTPTTAGYYRRAFAASCGAVVYTDPLMVSSVASANPGSISWYGHSGIFTLDTCKNVPLSLTFVPNGCDSTSVYWVSSTDKTFWTELGKSASYTVNASFSNNLYYSYYIMPNPAEQTCKKYSNQEFLVKVSDGVIARPDFYIDTMPVVITMDYGDATIEPFIYLPYFSPETGITVVNDKNPSSNYGYLLGRVGPGVYTIKWTLSDECSTKDFTIRYIVNFPICGTNYIVPDRDGNLYNTVRIGADCWLKENLKSQHYMSGDTIVGNFVYRSNEFPDVAANLSTYGRLYTWYAAVGIAEDSQQPLAVNEYGHVQGVCPRGWYVPSAEQYAVFNDINTIDLRSDSLWIDGLGTNLTGMTLLPGGYRSDVSGRFENMLGNAYFWSVEESTPGASKAFWIDCHCYRIYQDVFGKKAAMSIRCVKERDTELPQVTTNSVYNVEEISACVTGWVNPLIENQIYRGIVVGTEEFPSITNPANLIRGDSTSAGGDMNKSFTPLVPGTIYYTRAFSVTTNGVLYGEVIPFQTPYTMDTITFTTDPACTPGATEQKQYIIRGIPTALKTIAELGYSCQNACFKNWESQLGTIVYYNDGQTITTDGNQTLSANWWHPQNQASTQSSCDSYTWAAKGETYTNSGTYYYSHLDSEGCTQVDTLYLTINHSYTFDVDTTVNSLPITWHGKTFTAAGEKTASFRTVNDCDSIYNMKVYLNQPYTITYNKNGGTGEMPSQQVNQGDSVVLSNNTFTKTQGYKFYEWNTQPDGTGTSYYNQQKIKPTGNMTLYAQWKSFCTVVSRRNNETGTEYQILTVKDHQNNEYNVVQIGNQCWLRENMRATTSPSTGNSIMLSTMRQNTRSKAACYYKYGTSDYGTEFGVLYNWCAMMDTFKANSNPEVAPTNTDVTGSFNITLNYDNRRGICPEGWHVPSTEDWSIMGNAASVRIASSSSSGDGGLGKLVTGGLWSYESGSTTQGYAGNTSYKYRNSSGFSALPGGYWCYGNGFTNVRKQTHFWVAKSSAEVRCMVYEYDYLLIEGLSKYDANYVRCVRDNQ